MIHDSDEDTETAVNSLLVGAYGWKHGSWNDGFYPEDLPQDWQLTYYANEFSTVLVPASYYLDEDFDIEDLVEDVPEEFVFYLEYPEDESLKPRFISICEKCGDYLAGIVSQQNINMNAAVPVYLCGNGISTGQQVWVPGSNSSSGVAMLTLGEESVKTWRGWLEQFNQTCDGNLKAVFVSDEIIDMGKLQELKTLVELMGF